MDREKSIFRATLAGTAVNLLLMAFKFVAGFAGRSSAMIADAVHSASDFVTDLIVLVMVKLSGKPRDLDHQYGHGKYETMATAIIGLILLGVAAGIFWNGASDIIRVAKGETLEAPEMIALVAALVSIAAKEALYRYTAAVARRTDSQVLLANAWHHRSDALSSIAAAIGIGGALLLGERWRVLDPIAAMAVSVLIAKAALQVLVPSIGELLEKSLPKETEQQILEVIRSFPQVTDPHNLRTRRIGPATSIEAHLRVDGSMTVDQSHKIATLIEQALRQKLGPNTFINLHIEPAKNTDKEESVKNKVK